MPLNALYCSGEFWIPVPPSPPSPFKPASLLARLALQISPNWPLVLHTSSVLVETMWAPKRSLEGQFSKPLDFSNSVQRFLRQQNAASRITKFEILSLSQCATRRAEISGPPPGGLPTINRTGLVGNYWA